jgi:hypothetical protein
MPTTSLRPTVPLLLLGALAPRAHAQTIATVALQGQPITGVGDVVSVRDLAVDDSGRAWVYVATNHPDPARARVLIDQTGAVIHRDGDPLPMPTGSSIGNVGTVHVSSSGVPAYMIGLAAATPPGPDGVYVGVSLDLVFLEPGATSAPELPQGSALSQILEPRPNAVGQVAFQATVDDPGIPGQFDYRALMVVDTTTGSQSARYKTGDILPGQTWPISSLVWDTYGTSINDSGQVLFGATTQDSAGHNNVLYLDGTKIAQTGEPSPWGDNYLTVSSSVYGSALNNHGRVAFICNLSGDNGIVRDGQPFMRAGTEIVATSPFPIAELGQPIFLGDDDTVLWSGQWNVLGVQHRGLFADYALLVETQVTRIGGRLVEDLTLLDRSYAMSPSGQYVVFEAIVEGLEGAFLVDLWQ